MKWLRDLWGKMTGTPPQEARASRGELSVFLGGGSGSSSGEYVTEETALTYSAVYCAVGLLSGTLARLPVHVYRARPDGPERVVGHPVDRLLNVAPNDESEACVLREAWLAWTLLWGTGFLEVEKTVGGDPLALWLLESTRMRPWRDSNRKLWWICTPAPDGHGGGPMRPEKVLSFPAFTLDGICGKSPIRLAREGIGLALASERYGATFFGSGGVPSGTLEHPGKLTEKGLKELRESWRREHEGAGRQNRTAILEEGMKYNKIGVPPDDRQFLSTRKFQIAEVARWYRIPPHMLGDLERATFSNIEQQSINFLDYSLSYWIERQEQIFNRKLLTEDERKAGFYCETVTQALVRADMKTRYDCYNIGRQGGWLSVNKILKFENQPGIGPAGDVYLQPLNMVPAGTPAPPPKNEPPPAKPKEDPVPPDDEEEGEVDGVEPVV